MTWTITDHGDETYTVSGLTTLANFDFLLPAAVLEEREALYTEALAVGCVAGEHLMRLHGDSADMPSDVSDKLIEVHGTLDVLRIPPSWIDVDQQVRASAGSLTLGWGTGKQLQKNDLLLAFVSISSTLSSTIATPSGWTALRNDERVGARRVRTYVFYRFSDSDAAGSTAFVSTGATIDGMVGELHVIRDANRVLPIDNSNAGTGSATDPAAVSVTTTRLNDLVIAHLAHDHGVGGFSHTPAAGHDETTDIETASGLNWLSGASQIASFAAAGATGTVTFDCSRTTATDYVTERVAVRA